MPEMNPMMIIQMLKNGGSPQQIVLSMLNAQVQNNPMLANLVNLAKNNKTTEIEQIARNLFKERGMDFDKEYNNFRNQVGLVRK